jgi:hypothetical protein
MLTCTASGCEGFWCSRNIPLQKSLTGACHSALKALRYRGCAEIISDRATSCNSEALAHVSIIAVRQVGSENNEDENIIGALALVILLV